MPHMFINRSRIHDLTRGRSDLRAQFRWETINAVVYKVGGLVFIIGSLLFVLGACINVLQIIQAENRTTLQLMNLTAVTFVVGSVLFAVASVPYLWDVANPSLQVTLYTFLAWQYLIGSVLFLGGGVFNYWRAYLVVRAAIKGSIGSQDGGA